MRIVASADRVLTMLRQGDERELRRGVLKLCSLLRFESLIVWRRCNAAWRRRVATMEYSRLKREFYFLLAQCGLRRIARFYRSFCAYNSVLTRVIGEFVEQLGLEDMHLFNNLMINYGFNQICTVYGPRGFSPARAVEFEFDESIFDAESVSAQHSPSVSVAAQPQLSPLPTSSSDEDISTDDNLSHTAVVDINSQPPICSSPEEENYCHECDQGLRMETEVEGNNQPGVISAAAAAAGNTGSSQVATVNAGTEQVAEGPPPASLQGRAPEPTPAVNAAPDSSLSPPQPIAAGPSSDDGTSYYSSSDNEGGNAHHGLLYSLRNYTEPRIPLLQFIRETVESGDATDAAALIECYSRRTTPRERESHRIEDGTRLVYESFDENSIVDRRVNEVIRRYENTGELPSTNDHNYLITYMRRVANCPRAQELRWVYNMVEDASSALHTGESTADLLQRVRESLSGFAEP